MNTSDLSTTTSTPENQDHIKKLMWDSFKAGKESTEYSIRVDPVYIVMCDQNANDAFWLSQIIYWHGDKPDGTPRMKIKRDGHLWIVKTNHEWEAELFIKARTIRDSINRLEKKGLIIKMVAHFGKNHKSTYIRLDASQFIPQYQKAKRKVIDAKRQIQETEEKVNDGLRQIQDDQMTDYVSSNPETTITENTKDFVELCSTMENAASETTHHEQQEPEPPPAKERELPKRTKRGKDKAYSEACSFRASLSEREQLNFDNLHFALMRVQYHLAKNEIDMQGNANHRRYQKSTYKIVHTLMTSGYDLNPDTITAFGQWYSATYPNATMVKAIDKTCEHIDQFLQEHTERQQRLEAQRQKAPPRTQSETLTPERRAQLKAEILGTQSTFDFGTATEQPHDA